MWIFEHNFVADKAKIRRRAVARQVFFTQYAAKFAKKTRVSACADGFLLYWRKNTKQTPAPENILSLHNSQLFVKVIVSQHGLVFLGCQSGIRLEIVHKVGLVEVSQIGSNLRQRAPDVLILV